MVRGIPALLARGRSAPVDPQDKAPRRGAACGGPGERRIMDEAKAKKGRSGSEKRQRTAQHRIRLTPDEAANLKARADAAGMDVAAYVRRQTLDEPGPRTRRRMAVDVAELARARGALGYVGNNLNQIARAVNVGGAEALLDERRDVETTLARLNSLMDEITAAMGQAP